MAGVARPRIANPSALWVPQRATATEPWESGAEVQVGEMLFTNLSFWKKTCVVNLTSRICSLCFKPLVVCLRAQERSFLHR